MDPISMIMIALSLSVDSLVVSMSGSMSLRRTGVFAIFAAASVFAVMQGGLLFAGWLFGASVASLVHKVAHLIGFAILLWIGVSAIRSALKGDEDKVDISGMRSLMFSAVATSIDAFAVGISLAMSYIELRDALWLTAATSAVTFAASGSGVAFGRYIGMRFGKPARVVGGVVLILIGLRLLLSGMA